MTIEITLTDIICRFVAGISVILCIILYFYDRHKMDKWLKENSKDENNDSSCRIDMSEGEGE